MVDKKTSGAIASSTVNYPDGTTVSQFSAPNDSSGDASVTWKIEPDPPLGPYSQYKIIEKINLRFKALLITVTFAMFYPLIKRSVRSLKS